MLLRNISLRAFLAAFFLFLLVPPAAASADNANTYSGQATAFRASVLNLPPIVLADTGPLPSAGGAEHQTLVTASVPGTLTGGVLALDASALHAATVAQGNHSRSESTVADLNLSVANNSIAADFLSSQASASCGSAPSGSSQLVKLVINGQAITVTGQPNQTVLLPGGGSVIINEQTPTSDNGTAVNGITVNALHVIVPGVADVVIASAHADITCPPTPGPCQTPNDFVTGGGWIESPARDNFAVAGGVKNNGFWGHLNYIDHGTGMHVKGTGVTAYVVTGPTSRHIEGNDEVDGVPGTYKVDVADNGEPGHNLDTFSITLSNGYTAGAPPSDLLKGGNIQLHNPC